MKDKNLLRFIARTHTHTHTDQPDSLLGISERLSELGEVGVKVDGRRNDLQQTRLDFYWETAGEEDDGASSCLLLIITEKQHR